MLTSQCMSTNTTDWQCLTTVQHATHTE